MSSADILDRAQSILVSMNGQQGILGCLLVDGDGRVLTSSLPGDIDTAMIGSLCGTLFANNSISIRRMNRGDLAQMTLVTERGILHFYQVGNAILIVLTERGQKISLEGLLRLVEAQGQLLVKLVTSGA